MHHQESDCFAPDGLFNFTTWQDGGPVLGSLGERIISPGRASSASGAEEPLFLETDDWNLRCGAVGRQEPLLKTINPQAKRKEPEPVPDPSVFAEEDVLKLSRSTTPDNDSKYDSTAPTVDNDCAQQRFGPGKDCAASNDTTRKRQRNLLQLTPAQRNPQKHNSHTKKSRDKVNKGFDQLEEIIGDKLSKHDAIMTARSLIIQLRYDIECVTARLALCAENVLHSVTRLRFMTARNGADCVPDQMAGLAKMIALAFAWEYVEVWTRDSAGLLNRQQGSTFFNAERVGAADLHERTAAVAEFREVSNVLPAGGSDPESQAFAKLTLIRAEFGPQKLISPPGSRRRLVQAAGFVTNISVPVLAPGPRPGPLAVFSFYSFSNHPDMDVAAVNACGILGADLAGRVRL